jgi:YCII-related domain
MNTYLLVHRHPPNYTGDADTFAAWEAWFRELGDAVVDLGNPVLDDRGHTGDTGKAPPLGGYTIIDAADIAEATRLASRCPVIQDGGGVEIGRLTPIPGRKHPPRTF